MKQFDILYSFLFVQVTSFHFNRPKFKIIVSSLCHYLVFADKFFCEPKEKRFVNSKVASHKDYVRRLSVSYRMNVRTSQKMLGVHC